MNPETRLIETSDSDRLATAPLVSVLMIVYNHAEYLAAAIEGLVSQICEFPYEIIIGEDASSDDSLSIALDYQRRYPQLIRVLSSEENVGMNANSRRVRAAARGEFIAWCEGDDYWCDNHKIAKQAALLSSNPSMGAIHTDWVKSKLRNGKWTIDWQSNIHRGISPSKLEGNLLDRFFSPLILRTCTLMLRKSIADEIDRSEFGKQEYSFGDTVTALFITAKWSVGYLPIVTAVYRESPNSALRSGVPARIAFLRSALQFDLAARRTFGHLTDYPDAFRFETRVGLVLWSARGLDWSELRKSIAELSGEYLGMRGLRTGVQALKLRFPLGSP